LTFDPPNNSAKLAMIPLPPPIIQLVHKADVEWSPSNMEETSELVELLLHL
jgi:hypothetical protein